MAKCYHTIFLLLKFIRILTKSVTWGAGGQKWPILALHNLWTAPNYGFYRLYNSLPLHTGMPAETATAMCSMIFGGVLEKLPKLRVCFAHGGKSLQAVLATFFKDQQWA